MIRRVALAAALLAGAAACAGGPPPRLAEPAPPGSSAPEVTVAPRPVWRSTVAESRTPSLPVFAQPDAPQPVRQLAHPQPSGAPLVLLVQERQPSWLKVLLPVRPNGSSGWVRRADVKLYEHDFRIVIEIGAHRITVFKGEDVFLREPIGVGTTDTPTPGGLYYTKELIEPIDDSGRPFPNGPYGPYAYGLSGFSEVLYDFAGGEGVIGIHGTNDPSSLGRNVSKGCIRLSNQAITRLAKTLPLGVPVEIKA